MKLDRITQYSIEPTHIEDVNLVIACCGYEERCTSLLRYYSNLMPSIPYKYAVVYDSPNCVEIKNNARLFKEVGFCLENVSPETSYSSIIEVTDKCFTVAKTMNHCKVLIDYSSMTREWYSAMLLYLEQLNVTMCTSIECVFYYSIPKYDGLIDKQYAFSSVSPLTGYSSFLMPDKPLSLFIGLGSEERALTGIRQYADVAPSFVHYFYTNNEHIFSQRDSYKALFNQISDSNKHEYDLKKMIPLFNTMSDLYKMLSQEYRVAIISCGPKPFTLMSLIFARLFNVDVWKLKTNSSSHIVNKHSSGDNVTFSFVYNTKL